MRGPRPRPSGRLGRLPLVLVVIGLLSWVVAAPASQRGAQAAGRAPGPDAADGKAPDRWGELVVQPIVISPPLEYIPTDEGPVVPPRWYFPVPSPDDVTRVLTTVGFSEDDATRLREGARPGPAGHGGFVLMPDPAFVRALPTDRRAALYRQLARHPLNFSQQAAYRFYGRSIDDWLGRDLPPRIRALVDPLIYRDGDFLFFADLELVRAEIGRGPELQRLVKRLLRQATTLVQLQVDDPDRIDEIVTYWGVGGRRTDIRPLLESIASGADTPTVDITHLLPELPRRLLYRYPKVSLADLAKPQLANCFWTALNFFASTPDDRLLDPVVALDRLKNDYYLVQDAQQLGDIVAFSDSKLNIFHVAVYLADDLVFTKNGYFSLAPWTILPMDRLKGHFADHADDWRVTYYRRNDF